MKNLTQRNESHKKVLLDLKGNQEEVATTLPLAFKYAVIGFWIGLVCVFGYTSYHVVHYFSLSQRVALVKEEASFIRGQYIRLEQVDQSIRAEEDKATRIMDWMDTKYSLNHMFAKIFDEEFCKQVQCEKLRIHFTEGQPQVSVKMELVGRQDALVQQCSRINLDMESLGFKSISINQPWNSKGGITYDGLFMIPQEGSRS